jgi:hypothetical protein
MIQLGDMA